jgi:hypothetical protein
MVLLHTLQYRSLHKTLKRFCMSWHTHFCTVCVRAINSWRKTTWFLALSSVVSNRKWEQLFKIRVRDVWRSTENAFRKRAGTSYTCLLFLTKSHAAWRNNGFNRRPEMDLWYTVQTYAIGVNLSDIDVLISSVPTHQNVLRRAIPCSLTL